jgi:zinc transporter
MRPETNFRAAAGKLNKDNGLICGFTLGADGTTTAIEIDDIEAAMREQGRVVWLHFNAAHAGARRWLAQSTYVPDEFVQLLEEHDSRVQITATSSTLLAVINDFAFGEVVDPSEVVTIWVLATQRLIVTARHHASKTVDQLRLSARSALSVSSGPGLLAHLLGTQEELLRQWLDDAAHQLDQAEDRIVIGQVYEQRENLARIRRLAMHLRRHFAPVRSALHRLLLMPADSRGGIDADLWRAVHDDLAFAVDEASGAYERAKLLQEELSSRLAEATNRNLYVLTMWTIIFLPMTLITGVFGMNVAGVPGVGEHSAAAFWSVMLLIGAAGALVFLLVRRHRNF